MIISFYSSEQPASGVHALLGFEEMLSNKLPVLRWSFFRFTRRKKITETIISVHYIPRQCKPQGSAQKQTKSNKWSWKYSKTKLITKSSHLAKGATANAH